MAKKIIVKQTRSSIKRDKTQKLTLISLGLGSIGKVATHEATPSILGMINKVEHLVSCLYTPSKLPAKKHL